MLNLLDLVMRCELRVSIYLGSEHTVCRAFYHLKISIASYTFPGFLKYDSAVYQDITR